SGCGCRFLSQTCDLSCVLFFHSAKERNPASLGEIVGSLKGTMIFLTSWIPVLTTFLLLLYFWKAKVSASGTSEEEVIDPKYVIIGVTLGVFLAIGFLALKICMIKRQLIDNDFVGKRNILLLSDFRGNFFS
ncbi:hypothetical protein G0U57_014730, partial [Chelydra serpentina]